MINWKDEDIMSINIDELKKNLKSNPVFNMSLSGKEIFHSNVLAWLLSETDDNNEPTATAYALTEIFHPKDKKDGEQYRVLTVFREKNDFDLLIVYLKKDDYNNFIDKRKKASIDTKINIEDEADEIKFESDRKEALKDQMDLLAKCKFVVVENKFKAIPDNEQLENYYFEICGYKQNQKKEWNNERFINLVNVSRGDKIKLEESNTTCYLLAPQEALSLFETKGTYTKTINFDYKNNKTKRAENTNITVNWYLISYDELIKKIKPEGQNGLILNHYVDFTQRMLELSKDAVTVDNKTKLYDFEANVRLLKSIRIHDFYEKLWFSAVLAKIKNNLSDEINNNKLIPSVGYSNGMGMLNFMYDFEKYPEARFGIEIQAKQFRIAVYITNKKQYKWETKTGTTYTDPEKIQYEKIFNWVHSIYEQINQDNKEHFDYPDEKELELRKFADFKYIKIPLNEQYLTIEVLGKKIKEVLTIMKSKETDFKGKTQRI